MWQKQNVHNEYADEGQKQRNQMWQKWELPTVVAVAIVFTIVSIVGGVVIHHHFVKEPSAPSRHQVTDHLGHSSQPPDVPHFTAPEEVTFHFVAN